VQKCYDLAAEEYAKEYLGKLAHKPLDRYLLERFSSLLSRESVIVDFGCGSGQTTKYLSDLGHRNITGSDFSSRSILLARKRFPKISFEVDNILRSKRQSTSVDGIVAFYAIVHFTYEEISAAMKEWHRLLRSGGSLLISFHTGRSSVSVKNFLNVSGADANWNFFSAPRVTAIARAAGFTMNEALVRFPYAEVEHPSKRCYLLLRRR
jgi:SAM-dependent methyltransferase